MNSPPNPAAERTEFVADIREFTCDGPGQRLDRFLADRCHDLSRSRIKRLIVDGSVQVDSRARDAGYRLRPGQVVALTVPEPVPSHMLPQDIPIDVVYEDDWLMVVDKPAGLPVHPGPGHPDSTLVNAISGMRPEVATVGGTMRPGLVHRLDKDTSGLMVVAKTDAAQAVLSNQMKLREIDKRYTALVHGVLSPPEAVIEAPIGRDPRDRKRMAIIDSGRNATTVYSTLTQFPRHTLADVVLKTGRTHQIRVHFASIGHPVVGDGTYGTADSRLGRHFLHAHKLGFRHPASSEYVECDSTIPDELQARLDDLRLP